MLITTKIRFDNNYLKLIVYENQTFTYFHYDFQYLCNAKV